MQDSVCSWHGTGAGAPRTSQGWALSVREDEMRDRQLMPKWGCGLEPLLPLLPFQSGHRTGTLTPSALPLIPCRTEQKPSLPRAETGSWQLLDECLQPSLPCVQCTACTQVVNDFLPKKWAQVKNSCVLPPPCSPRLEIASSAGSHF